MEYFQLKIQFILLIYSYLGFLFLAVLVLVSCAFQGIYII